MNDEITTEVTLTPEQVEALRVDGYLDGSGEATQPEAEVFIGEDPSDHVAG